MYLLSHFSEALIDVLPIPSCVCELQFEFPANVACLLVPLPYQAENLAIVAFELHSHFLTSACNFMI